MKFIEEVTESVRDFGAGKIILSFSLKNGTIEFII